MSGFGGCTLLLLLLMLLFPAASVSYSDFCVNEMWPKGIGLHPEEVHGEAGLGGSMGWYVLICIGTRGKEPLGELLGKMTEAASVNEFERLEKTECKGKKIYGNGIQLRRI